MVTLGAAPWPHPSGRTRSTGRRARTSPSKPIGGTTVADQTSNVTGGEEQDPEDRRLRREILREQVDYLIKTLGGPENAAAQWDEDGGLAYVYRPGYILARDEDAEDVASFAGAELAGERGKQRQRGLSVLRVPGQQRVQNVLEQIDDRFGVGVATPEHILFVTPGGGGALCPAIEPEEPGSDPAPYPAIASDPQGGRNVLVSVVDTGWWPPAATDPVSPWLAGVDGDPETIDPAHIHPYAGHGTFIAGVVRTQAPSAGIYVEGFLPIGGAVYESDIVVQLGEALERSPDVISLSAGCPTRKHLPLMGFEVFWERRLRHHKGTVLVAAAGNDGHRLPFWPAAFPWAVSVGALDAAGGRADYSNFGSWVDVYALGSDQVNAYPAGTFICQESPHVGEERHFKGIARWSGTSFATPLVAGLVAARMSSRGVTARVAADELLAEARANARPGVGPVLEPLP
jgi:subtilisin family serine protease